MRMIAPCFCSTCGAANEPARTRCFACNQFLVSVNSHNEVHEGVLLHNRYQLGILLGSGGFSAVYQARDTSEDGKVVAIKQITLQGMSAEAVIEATDTFNRELLMLSALTHPQILCIYNHFTDQYHWYLVLE